MGDSGVRVRAYRDTDEPGWDALVARSWNGTFLHTRRFLDYHGDRFRDLSMVVVDAADRLLGVLPVAEDPLDARRAVSHPGLTYGGLVHAGALLGEGSITALQSAADLVGRRGYDVLRYKTIPSMYHRIPTADDLYALFRLGSHRYRCDLAATVDLEARGPVRRNRRRNLEDAQQAGLVVSSGVHHLPEFWEILTSNLMTKFGVRPAHTLLEMQDLVQRFPGEISCHVVLSASEVLAGLVNFHTARVLHCQYSAANERGFREKALDLAFSWSIDDARTRGNRYFDFGVCNEREGRVLNSNLYDFKVSFGAGSTPHEFYELSTS